MSDGSSFLRFLATDGDTPERRQIVAEMSARVGGWTIIGACLIWLVAASVAVDLPTRSVLLCFGAIAIGCGVVALVRSDRVRLASLLMVGGCFAIVTASVVAAGHVLAPASMGFFAVATMAALTLGGRAGLATIVTSIAVLASITLWPRVSPAPPVEPNLMFVALATILLVMGGMISFARGRLDSALDSAEKRNRELESERERFEVLSESSKDLITELDLEGNVRYASPNHLEVLGWSAEEIIGRDWVRVVHPEDASTADPSAAKQAHGGEIPAVHYRVQHRDGTPRWLESAGRIYTTAQGEQRLVSVTRDISQRVALEAQLRQSQKLEAVGRLAGGVAHDFNNLLTVINGYSEVLLAEQDGVDDTALQEIHSAGQRAQALTRQLLTFSRHQALQPRVLDLDEVLSDVETLLLRLLGDDIKLSFQRSPEPLNVFMDPSELEQIVVNLAVNARDAMPRGGRIEIATRPETETRPAERGSHEKESWAVLTVTDEGIGMSEDVLSHIFEPFFSTKATGEGTGLGLAMIHGIVEQSGGRIAVESEPDQGTRFRIYLPRVEEPVSDQPVIPSAQPRAAGPETILLAEDDPAIRRLVTSTLCGSGYRVIESANGEEALGSLQRDDERIDLLLTDVMMPEMGGPELRTRLSELRPSVPAVLMSGYAEQNQGAAEPDPLPGDRSIRKPFTRSELLTAVRAALDSAKTNASR